MIFVHTIGNRLHNKIFFHFIILYILFGILMWKILCFFGGNNIFFVNFKDAVEKMIEKI